MLQQNVKKCKMVPRNRTNGTQKPNKWYLETEQAKRVTNNLNHPSKTDEWQKET